MTDYLQNISEGLQRTVRNGYHQERSIFLSKLVGRKVLLFSNTSGCGTIEEGMAKVYGEYFNVRMEEE
jgi:thiazole synthase ThiGH ThiG subunit